MIILFFTLWQRCGHEKKAPRVNKVPLRKRRIEFAKLVKAGGQEEDFEEYSLFYTLTLNEVEARYFSGRARD